MKRMLQLPCRLVLCQMSSFSLKAKFGVGLGSIGLQRNIHHTMDSNPGLKPPPSPPLHGKEVKEIQIPVPWGHISGKWWGRTDVQPVLLLHGWQDNAGSFDTLVPMLSNDSLLAVEMVGHGLSSHYPLGQCYSYIDAVTNLRRVVMHFGWEKISCISHSMGSMLALAYASMYSDGIEKFVSIDNIPGAILDDILPVSQEVKRIVEANLSFEKKLANPTPSYTYDDIVDLYLKGSHGSIASREMAEIILKRGIVKSANGDGFYFSRDPRVKIFSWGSLSEESVYAMASNVMCEVLHIRAFNSFTNNPFPLKVYENTLSVIEKTAKRFESHVVKGTHHVHLNTPEVVAPLINKFFESKGEEGLIY